MIGGWGASGSLRIGRSLADAPVSRIIRPMHRLQVWRDLSERRGHGTSARGEESMKNNHPIWPALARALGCAPLPLVAATGPAGRETHRMLAAGDDGPDADDTPTAASAPNAADLRQIAGGSPPGGGRCLYLCGDRRILAGPAPFPQWRIAPGIGLHRPACPLARLAKPGRAARGTQARGAEGRAARDPADGRRHFHHPGTLARSGCSGIGPIAVPSFRR